MTDMPDRSTTRKPALAGLLVWLGALASAGVLFLFLSRGGDPRFIALGLALLGVGIVATRNPLLCLGTVTVILVANVSDNLITYFGAPSVAKLAVPGLTAILLFRYLFNRDRPFINLLSTGMLGFYALLISVSILYATEWDVAYEALIDYLKDLLFALLVLAFFSFRNAYQVFTWSMLAAVSFCCVLCFYSFIINDFSFNYYGYGRVVYVTNRLSGPINDPNFFGAVLVFLIPIAIARTFYGKSNPERMLAAIIVVILAAAMILTKSRGAMLSAGLSFGVLLLLLDKRSMTYASIAAVLVVTVVALTSSEAIIQRFEDAFAQNEFGTQQDRAVEGRLASWTVAAQLFFDHPFLGVGAGNYNLHFQNYALDLGLIFRGEGRSAHSLYLEVLAELGAIGLLTLLGIIGMAFFGVAQACAYLKSIGDRSLRAEYAAFGLGMVGYFAAMAFLHDSYPRLLYTVIAIAIAMPRIARIATAERAAPVADASPNVAGAPA